MKRIRGGKNYKRGWRLNPPYGFKKVPTNLLPMLLAKA